MENPYSIRFKIISEIRNGSPYNIAHLKIDKDFPFEININDSWQDKYSWSPNKKGLALVKWEIIENKPGFKIYTFDLKKHKVYKSDLIKGCCHKIKIRNDLTYKYEAYSLPKKKE